MPRKLRAYFIVVPVSVAALAIGASAAVLNRPASAMRVEATATHCIRFNPDWNTSPDQYCDQVVYHPTGAQPLFRTVGHAARDSVDIKLDKSNMWLIYHLDWI